MLKMVIDLVLRMMFAGIGVGILWFALIVWLGAVASEFV